MKFTNITGNATTVVAPIACKLLRVVINNAGASANTAAVYDNASAGSGTLVGTIDTVELNGRVLEYGVRMQNGITVVTATGTAGDITVVWE